MCRLCDFYAFQGPPIFFVRQRAKCTQNALKAFGRFLVAFYAVRAL